ncbi:unnamed protein product (macronuclear) [Paramecium tetraurelia]|uniref:FCP1 homology domain-containing protein n=1 Tax=Paramecium tetraurelia TaxID=5888 RepID=A0DNV3_PARTE|nr:uncharacterized protein GSPATT00018916001 [Paramecium tetraurelia]CAK84720.1 unnamed protein product [Paramecium tetraurelia]|eukprot:XP_001452117.1 hypothetical protein (macronuclear) [Paramecium tetraurelia strain d4-2]
MEINCKLPPKITMNPLYYSNGARPVIQYRVNPNDQRRYTADIEAMRKYSKSQNQYKQNDVRYLCDLLISGNQQNSQQKSQGIARANTADKQQLEDSKNQYNSSRDNKKPQQPQLFKVQSQAKPIFENFSKCQSQKLKNHSFVTQHKQNEKPHSFKQIAQKGPSQISHLYYVADLQNAILNQKLQSSALFREHIQSSFTYIPVIKNLQIDKEQIQEKLLNIPINLNKKCKDFYLRQDNKTIIFDMDETLIHCNEDENDKCQFKIDIQFEDGEIIEAGINIRNFAREIIQKLSDLCEVMIFTASQDVYANKVINILDPNNKLSYRIFRESCISVGDNNLIKHLGVLNRDLKNVVLIDNSSYSFAHHLENGIPILPYYYDDKDNQLIKLYRYLCQNILPADDVRPVILQHFKLDRLNQYESVEEAVQNLYF